MKPLHIDFETRSAVDLKDANSYIYFDDATSDVLCAAYAFGDAEPELWWPGDPCPPEIAEHIRAGGEIHAWNAAFERLAIRQILGPRYGWPVPDLRQYRCTMVSALAMALPGKLEHAAPALGLTVTKDAQGSRLMLQMAKPRRPRKGENPSALQWWSDGERQQRLGQYCLQDVRTEQAVSERILPLSASEQNLWFLDQEINDAGVHIDKNLCLAAKAIVARAEARLDKEMQKVTDFAVNGVSATTQLTAWLRAQGLDVPGVAKDVIEALLIRDDLAPNVRRAVEIRQEGGKTSVAKIDAMLARRQKDGRMRGNLQFHGAGTGRWAGRGAQLQNLPRPSSEDDKQPMIEAILESKDDRLIEAMYGNTLTVVSDCIRGMITAGPGNDLLAADYESIESVVNAWLAGHPAKLKAFEDYFAGNAPKIYNVVAADVFNCKPSEIGKGVKYQVGKVTELSMGYQGGPGAFAKMAKNYGLEIATASESVLASATPENIEKAAKGWEQRGKRSGMTEIRWKTAELIKLAWRARNQPIVDYWKALEAAAIEAVANPGKQVVAGKTGKIAYKRVGSFLFCRLPSGRVLSYPYPRLVEKKMPWTNDNGEPVYKPSIEYKGVNSTTRQWMPQSFYGGLADENVVQAVARDCMVVGMKAAAKAGYAPVLTVHDEVVCEAPKGFGSLEAFSAAMLAREDWMKGLPLSADGWRGHRYRK